MTETSTFRAALTGYVAANRAKRAERAERAALESALRSYRTVSERAEMDAILGRYPESATHQAWESVSGRAA